MSGLVLRQGWRRGWRWGWSLKRSVVLVGVRWDGGGYHRFGVGAMGLGVGVRVDPLFWICVDLALC